MNWTIFWTVMFVGVGMVLLQGICSYTDGYFTEGQMFRRHGIENGWSFMQHGGMWSDVFIITPVVAFVLAKYDLHFTSPSSLGLLGISVVITLLMLHVYSQGGLKNPEAHTHQGTTTAAGWIHAVFAIVAMWIIIRFYATPLSPMPNVQDILIVSCALTPFFLLGVVKFTNRWTFESGAMIQVLVLTAVVWIAAGVRLWLLAK